MHEPAPPLTIRLSNDGHWYRVGAIVSVVRVPGLDLIPRRDGQYQVESCTYVPGAVAERVAPGPAPGDSASSRRTSPLPCVI